MFCKDGRAQSHANRISRRTVTPATVPVTRQQAASVRVCNNTSFLVQTLLHSCDQKRQKTCDQKNVPNAETVQRCLVCKHQPLSLAANIPNRCRWLEGWGNPN